MCKIGCPITLGEYNKIKESESNNLEVASLETISLLWSNPYNQLDSSIFTNLHNLKELYISCSEQDKENGLQ